MWNERSSPSRLQEKKKLKCWRLHLAQLLLVKNGKKKNVGIMSRQ